MKNIKLKSISIKTKLTIIPIFLFGITILSSAFICKAVIKNKMQHTLLQNSIEQAREIADQAEMLLTYDKNKVVSLQKFVEKKANQDNIAYAVVINRNVKAIAHSDKQKIGKIYKDDYTIDGAKNGNEKTSRFYADIQKIWTYDVMVPIYKDRELYGVLDIGIPEKGIKQIISTTVVIQLTISIIGFLLIGAILTIMFNKTFKPLEKLVSFIQKTSELNFKEDAELEKLILRNDEIGKIAKIVENMRKSLRDIIKSIMKSSAVVNKSSGELSRISDETLSSVNEVASSITNIAEGTESQAVDMQKGSEKINELSLDIDKVIKTTDLIGEETIKTNKLSKDGLESIEKLSFWSNKNKESSKEVEKIVTDMDKNSLEITNIVDTINEVADKTKLLALNASIEAARAGEAGRGFSVVADEIRKLAEQTAISTEEIREKINSIKERSGQAVNVIKESVEIVDKNNESANSTKKIFNNISEFLISLQDRIEEVVNHSQNMKTSKNNIVESIENISSLAEENSSSTEEISSMSEEQIKDMEILSKHAEELTALSDSLQEEINKFTL